MGGDVRPFCPDCDYCERDYFLCKDIGFRDFLDSLLFVSAAIPGAIEFFLFAGLNIVDWYIALLGIFTVVLFSLGPAGFLFYVPLIAGSSLIAWGTSLIITEIPVALILLVITVLIGYELPSLQSNVFRATFGIISFLLFVWFITLFTGRPDISGSFSIPSILDDIAKFFNTNAFFSWWFPSLDFLRTRFQRFIYPSGTLPFLDVFCFSWTFSNTGAAAVFAVAGGYVGTVVVREAWVILIFLWAILSALWTLINTIRLHQLRERVEENAELQEEMNKQLSKLKDKVRGMSRGIGGALQPPAWVSRGISSYERHLDSVLDIHVSSDDDSDNDSSRLKDE